MKRFLVTCLSLVGLCAGIWVQRVHANEFSTRMKQVSLQPYGQWYQLKVVTNFNLSPVAIKALQSSIPLVWCLELKLQRIGFIWNKNLFEAQYCYKIQYHALLKTYSIRHKEPQYFHDVTSALKALSVIEKVTMIKSSEMKADENYKLQVKWQFDREALPLPLRPLSYLDSQWDLSSDWTLYLWTNEP